MPQEEIQVFASIMNSLGVVGVLAFTWWITRQDMKDERDRRDKQREADIARYDKELLAERTRSERDILAAQTRADRMQAAIMKHLTRTSVPDDSEAEAEKKKGL